MNTYTPKRRSRGSWITRFAADHADIRTLADAIAFVSCGALCALLVWMVFNPRHFFELVTGVFA